MHQFLLVAIGVLLLIWPVSRWLHEVRLRKIAQKRLRISRTVTEMEKLGPDPLFPVMFKAQFRDDFPMARELTEGERQLADRICGEMSRSGSPTGRLWVEFISAYYSALFYMHPVRVALLMAPFKKSRSKIAAQSATALMRRQPTESGGSLDADIMGALLNQTEWLKPQALSGEARPLHPRSDAHLELFKEVLSGAVYEESAWTLVQWETRPRLQSAVINALSKLLGRYNIVMAHMRPFEAHVRAKGKDWPLVGYSMIGRKRMDNLQACVETVIKDGIPGDLIETGVWRGGAVMLMKAILKAHGVTDRTLWIADSFAGLPKPDSASDGTDYSENKFLAVSRRRVQSNFERFGLMDENVKFLEGWFSDTLPGAPIKQLAILRLDGDLYSSTMDALAALYPKVSKGGFVIVDDFHGWPGCKRAIQEYLLSRGESPAIQSIDEDGAYWRVS
jgi:O-methyltransferase